MILLETVASLCLVPWANQQLIVAALPGRVDVMIQSLVTESPTSKLTSSASTGDKHSPHNRKVEANVITLFTAVSDPWS